MTTDTARQPVAEGDGEGVIAQRDGTAIIEPRRGKRGGASRRGAHPAGAGAREGTKEYAFDCHNRYLGCECGFYYTPHK